MSNNKDTLYRKQIEAVPPFEFNEHVARVFPDMIRRSVPGYDLLCSLSGVVAANYAKAQTNVYDLGCSLGGSTLAMRHSLEGKDLSLIAIDNSAAMLNEFKTVLAKDSASTKVETRCEDIRESEITNASLIAMNFVLQFIPLEDRFALLEKIYTGLLDSTCLLMSEKIQFDDGKENEFQIELHHKFKAMNGYDELEIANKRTALEKVLIPESIETHIQRLKDIGFSEVYISLQCFNFVSFLAIK